MKKVFGFILNVLTFGLSFYFRYKTERAKLLSVYQGVKNQLSEFENVYNLLKEGKLSAKDAMKYIDPERVKSVLKSAQELNGVAGKISADLKETFRK